MRAVTNWMGPIVLLAGLGTACGGGGGSSSSAPMANLSYAANPAVFTLGQAAAPDRLLYSGQPGATFSISPALPSGLRLDPATGAIGGTPAVLSPAASYQVTAHTGMGDLTCGLSLAVVDLPPSSLTYPTNPAVFAAGTPISGDTPATSGGAPVTFAIVPALPAGLAFNAADGTISGTAAGPSPATDYTVTVTNSGGSASTRFTLTVTAPAVTITSQPANQAVALGQSAQFTVAASGTSALAYQWLLNGAALPGAQSATFTTAPAAFTDSGGQYTVQVTDAFGGTALSAPATLHVLGADPLASAPAASMTARRAFHTSTLLQNGKVLIAGGYDGASLASAELYDPATGTFTATGSMSAPRDSHTATLLASGKVLIAGGNNASQATATAELYDPASGAFSPAASMGTARSAHTAVLLQDGRILVTAGRSGSTYLASSEIYDPLAGTFTPTGSLAGEPRATHTATLLPSGKVLVAGGYHLAALADAQVWDPTTGQFTAAGTLASPRAYHTATLLPDGEVLVVGGTPSGATEKFNPTTNLFIPAASLATARTSWHTATLTVSGKVLVAGGEGPGSPAPLLATTEIYDPAANTFAPGSLLASPRELQSATLLHDGRLLFTGGLGASGYLDTAELFQ